MLRAISETAVAIRVRSVREKSSLDASSRALFLARTTSASCWMRIVISLSPCRPSFEKRLAELGTQLTLQDMPGGIDLALTAPIAPGYGIEHGTATIGRRFDVVQGQQVLHPHTGPRPVELGRHRAG